MWKRLLAALLCSALLLPQALALEGMDVSVYQGDIDFAAAKADGIQVVYIRSGFGEGGVDDTFRQNYAAAARAGLSYGFYHYLEADDEAGARAEARHFASLIRDTGYTCRPALDFEVDEGMTDAQIVAIILAFLTEVEALTGDRPMLYADQSTAARLDAAVAEYPLWIAEWEVDRPDLAPTPWTAWTGWQYTDEGRVSGIGGDVDRDRFTEGVFLSGQEPEDPPKPPETITYTVRWGDTLWALSRRFGTTVAALAEENNIKDPNLIYVGQILQIPGQVGRTYTVQWGDTLWQIGRTYGVTVAQLVAWNHIQDPDLIYPGQVLRIGK